MSFSVARGLKEQPSNGNHGPSYSRVILKWAFIIRILGWLGLFLFKMGLIWLTLS
uniref:hypothetical protein n=1 Tax=Flavobacterium sp. TaxID=239 RepID=UPI00404B9CE1